MSNKTTQKPKTATVYSRSGSRYVDIKKRVYDEKLKTHIVIKTGEKVDLSEQIKASDCLTDMALLKREKMRTGQIPNVNPNIVSGVDLSIFPDSIHDVYRVHSEVNAKFNALSPEVRNAFGNSVDNFYTACMDGTAKLKISKHFESLSKKAQDDVEGGQK